MGLPFMLLSLKIKWSILYFDLKAPFPWTPRQLDTPSRNALHWEKLVNIVKFESIYLDYQKVELTNTIWSDFPNTIMHSQGVNQALLCFL